MNLTNDVTANFSQQDIQDNKLMGILSYLFLLVLVPIFAARKSRYAMFNASQGVVLAVLIVVINIVLSLLGWIPVIGWLIRLVCGIINLAILALAIWGIVNVVQGKAVKLPLIGHFSEILKSN